MNKLIKLTLCFMVNICAGFEFTDSDEKPTDPSMWCAPEKRDEFKQLCNSEIANLNANSDDSSENYDKTYLLMNIFSEKLEDDNIVEEFKLQIPQNISCCMTFKSNCTYIETDVISGFIKLVQNNYSKCKEKLIIKKLNISSTIEIDIKKDIWKDTSSHLQINMCKFSGEYERMSLQYFPCNQYDFTNVNCHSVFLPIMPQCDIYACESQITIKIDESEYDADKQYCANITHIYISYSEVSYESDTSSNASSYKPYQAIRISDHNLDNLTIKMQETTEDLQDVLSKSSESDHYVQNPQSSRFSISPTTYESTVVHFSNQSPRFSLPSNDAQEPKSGGSQVSLISESLDEAFARLSHVLHAKSLINTSNIFSSHSKFTKEAFQNYLIGLPNIRKSCAHQKTQCDLPENIEELSERKIKRALQISSRDSQSTIKITRVKTSQKHQHKQMQCDF